MAEPFAKPTKEQVEKARELYGDPLLYWATNCTVKWLNEIANGKSSDPNPLRSFYRECRLIIRNEGVDKALNEFCKAVEDVANDTWTDFVMPDFNEKEDIKGKGIVVKGNARRNIDANIKISQVAKSYGLKVRGKMAVCPFHDDKDPSLSFDDKKNIFHCFGCNTSGDIVEFKRLLMEREERNGNKEGS